VHALDVGREVDFGVGVARSGVPAGVGGPAGLPTGVPGARVTFRLDRAMTGDAEPAIVAATEAGGTEFELGRQSTTSTATTTRTPTNARTRRPAVELLAGASC